MQDSVYCADLNKGDKPILTSVALKNAENMRKLIKKYLIELKKQKKTGTSLV
ncbi:conserved hypothetical protein [Acinetobacter proteolyticus]|uniref:Uncharacterized protein n=1 Tax=Acinetobacter proteolyticus TaxID=1776741 RepID=A0A653K9U3_9GAMM|nr:hypothetical protein L293_2340 [Acinetobacter gyllenbergii CIP 110306 = MTCC 11365]VXA56786.1 conserved hypothetical protein [Acinetobacter proteolyticus]